MSDTLSHVHETHEGAATVTLSPPHAPRVETEAFKKTRQFLIHEKKQGCAICGVTIDGLSDPQLNSFGAKTLEAHHSPIEFSQQDACDPRKVHNDYPEVIDRETLAAFVDSPRNMIILCSTHHRDTERGIHHMLAPDFWIQKYLYSGYQIAATEQDAAAVEAKDEKIEQLNGIEPTA